MARTRCNDHVVGAILASWRYDISGISPEMRKDYEQHFADCGHCRARLKFHRSLDVTLAVLTSLAVIFFSSPWQFCSTSSPSSMWLSTCSASTYPNVPHVMSAGYCGGVFSIDCVYPRAHGDSGVHVPERYRGGTGQDPRRASPRSHPLAALSLSWCCDSVPEGLTPTMHGPFWPVWPWNPPAHAHCLSIGTEPERFFHSQPAVPP